MGSPAERRLATTDPETVADLSVPDRSAFRNPNTLLRWRETVERAREFLSRNATEPVYLDDIAAVAAVSPAQLCKIFVFVTGEPPHRYLNRLRLRLGLERLAGGCTDLTALALDLGFSSHSHFSAAFRREFGVTPSAWRNASR